MAAVSTTADLQSDVDLLIFDYLGFKGCEALLSGLRHAVYHDDKPSPKSLARTLDITYGGGYFSTYLNLHAALPDTGDFGFRRQLLDFMTTLWRWKVACGDGTIRIGEGKTLQSHPPDRALRGQVDGASGTEAMPTNSSPYALIHTIPSFMALSAKHLAIWEDGNQVTENWMQLAAEYILQAVLEQILVFRNDNLSMVHRAFAWEFDENSVAEEGSDSFITNAMFFNDEAGGTDPRWQLIRAEYMGLLLRAQPKSLFTHANDLLATEWSPADFQKRVLAFLNNLHSSMPRPFVVECEDGNVELST